ncbi:MAG: hypothetical protein R2825_06570 [Saprospiraceae bacterium]
MLVLLDMKKKGRSPDPVCRIRFNPFPEGRSPGTATNAINSGRGYAPQELYLTVFYKRYRGYAPIKSAHVQ